MCVLFNGCCTTKRYRFLQLPPSCKRRRRVAETCAAADCARCEQLSGELQIANNALHTTNAALEAANREIAELNAQIAVGASIRAAVRAAAPTPINGAPPLHFFSPPPVGQFEVGNCAKCNYYESAFLS